MKPCTRLFLNRKILGLNQLILLTALLGGGVTAATAEDGYWINSGGGSWASAGNWDPANGIAGGADDTAYFGFAREAAISSSAAFTLDGAQTIGNLFFTSQGGAGTWSFNAGAGGSLNLDATFGPSQITVTAPSLQVSLNAVISGAGVEKDGPGTLVLAGKNSYSGETLVNGGGLDVTGTVGSGGVSVSGATLSGTGVINGPVVVGAGGVLALGNASSPLTINSSLVLLPGSTTSVAINPATAGRPVVQGLSSVTYGGTLIVSDPSGGLSLGQTFSLFGSAAASGDFTSIQPPPGPWLRWRVDPATGQITVVSSASQPAFADASLNNANLLLRLTNGPPGAASYIVASTNLSLPKSAWTRIATNVFDMSGNLIFTNLMNANGSSQVYLAAFVVPSP